MARLNINIGTSVNDKNGDPLRTAFQKVNANFTELYNTAAADSTDRLVNGDKTVVLRSDGVLVFPDGGLIGSQSPGLYIEVPDLFGIAVHELPWSFDAEGRLNVPSLYPRTFTAVLDTAHMQYPDPAVALDPMGTPWTMAVTFSIVDGAIETSVQQIFPILGNPGYVSGYTFGFTYADHGIPGYGFSIELQDVTHPGGAGWTANIAVSGAPPLSPSISSTETLVLHGNNSVVISNGTGIHEEQFRFQGRNLILPGNGDIRDYLGNSVLGGASTGNIGFTANTMYDLGGVIIENSDLSHGPTAALILPTNSQTLTPIQLNNLYGDITLQASSTGGGGLKTWTFGGDGSLTLPAGANIVHDNVRLSLNLDEGNAAYLTTTTDDTTALHLTVDSAQLYAGQSVSIQAGESLAVLENIYTDYVMQLSLAFEAESWTGAGYPASHFSYRQLSMAKALNPLIPDYWIALSKSGSDAWDAWQIALDNTNISVGVAGNTWTFSNNGKITLPAGGNIVDNEGETVLGFASTSYSLSDVLSTILAASNTSGVIVAGNVTGTFPTGTEIQFESLAGAEFTVASATYDPETDTTGIIITDYTGFGPVDGDKIYLEYHGVQEIYAGDGIALGVTEGNSGRVLTIAATGSSSNLPANGAGALTNNGSGTLSWVPFPTDGTGLVYGSRLVFVDGNGSDLSFQTLSTGWGKVTANNSEGFGLKSSGNIRINSNNSIWSFSTSGDITFPDSTTQTTAYTGIAGPGAAATSVGYIGMPQNSQSSSYTLVFNDQGKHIYVSATGSITIPTNVSVPFPIGTTIAIIAGSGATATIAITGDTLYLAGTGETGSRTLAPFGMATLVKVAATTWFVSGIGLA